MPRSKPGREVSSHKRFLWRLALDRLDARRKGLELRIGPRLGGFDLDQDCGEHGIGTTEVPLHGLEAALCHRHERGIGVAPRMPELLVGGLPGRARRMIEHRLAEPEAFVLEPGVDRADLVLAQRLDLRHPRPDLVVMGEELLPRHARAAPDSGDRLHPIPAGDLVRSDQHLAALARDAALRDHAQAGAVRGHEFAQSLLRLGERGRGVVVLCLAIGEHRVR